ncbi:SPFH domain-containing protein [Kitasatospora sp. GP82]|uniref:SPFH domain-containing protein n=1 Tax=Kitasatospora sp. GP82 TaxID=3035089 RepID=UPI0024743642|nr:SPFH domain-containing protein [Kitasatospora sp. GP82]MDH6123540.1 regulator of protease activity HflC (stomatin/prohibitin superfamily) [Kitasatospora sp. GP82]
MDITRDSSPRPDSWPQSQPEPTSAESAQLRRAVAEAVAAAVVKPLIKAHPVPVEDEVDGPETLPLVLHPVPVESRRPSAGSSADPRPVTAGAALPPSDARDTPGRGRSERADAPSEPHTARRPPRSDPSLREQRARSLPGWLAVLALLGSTAALLLVLARSGVTPQFAALPDLRGAAAKESGHAEIDGLAIAAVGAVALVKVVTFAGLLVNAGGQTRVLTRWGRYRGTVRRTGLVWVSPLLRRRRVDVRLRHWRSEPVGVADGTGTPIVVRLLIVWRVKDTARAVLGIAEHEEYLREQAHAVLTRTASALPCDGDSAPGPALRAGQWFSDELTRALAAEVAPTGIEVYSVQPLSLDYAPEVADSMRRRRLADLDASLRTVLVDDAVETAAFAVRRLERATAHELDEAGRRSLMEQLLLAFVAPAGVTAPVPGSAARAGRREGKSA